MSRTIRFTVGFYEDFDRYYGYLAEVDIRLAERAYESMEKAMTLLVDFPLMGRRALGDNAFAREMIIPFGANGYVLLYEVEDDETVTILAVRHQREDDYH